MIVSHRYKIQKTPFICTAEAIFWPFSAFRFWLFGLCDEIRSALSAELTQRLNTQDISGLAQPPDKPVLRIKVQVRRLDNWPGRLRYFLTVAEELHFGRAALRLHLAQPPLTRQISALETELGFRLFDRTSRAVSLTAQGRHFLPYARAVLEQADLTEVIASKLAAGSAGQLVSA